MMSTLVHSRPTFGKDCLLFPYNSPPVSYIYSSKRTGYLFDDPKMKQLSFIPSIEIEGKEVIFTFNQGLSLYYDKSFIHSLSELFKKIHLPQKLNQDLLDKIATIANYLAKGEKYTYLPGTAKQQGLGLVFEVEKGNQRRHAILSSLTEDAQIHYDESKKH